VPSFEAVINAGETPFQQNAELRLFARTRTVITPDAFYIRTRIHAHRAEPHAYVISESYRLPPYRKRRNRYVKKMTTQLFDVVIALSEPSLQTAPQRLSKYQASSDREQACRYASSVCRRERMLRGIGLAAANLVSRYMFVTLRASLRRVAAGCATIKAKPRLSKQRSSASRMPKHAAGV
jgi:hypothetical protein